MSQRGRRTTDLPPPISVSSLSRHLSFPPSGLVFDAPPDDVNGQVSPEQAYDACLTDAAYLLTDITPPSQGTESPDMPGRFTLGDAARGESSKDGEANIDAEQGLSTFERN
jgi:hypothetical protein